MVSNPPYVDPALRDTLAPEILEHEPGSALFADEAGRAVIRRIIAEAGGWLSQGGWLGIEISPEQSEETRQRFSEKGYTEIQTAKDLSGNDRFTYARRG